MSAPGKSHEGVTTEELFALYRESGDQQLKWEIAMRYTGLIKSIALQIRGVFCSFTQLDDIINEGLIVLAEAVDKFDPEKGRFEVYVAKRIRGMIVDLARQQDWVPRTVRQRAQRIERAATELYNETGRYPSDAQIAEHLGMSIEEYQETLTNSSLHSILSLQELFESSDLWPSDPGTEEGAQSSPEQRLMDEELTETLAKAIGGMKENEQLVLSLYYEKNLKMKDIAAVMDITPPRVSQIHARAVQKLKVMMEQYLRGG
jgi:RNA polymerase sigma factor for flagellar operon FliA